MSIKCGDRVMVYMPSEVKGKTWKLARPFHGPYCVEAVTNTNAEVRLVDKPTSDTIFVHLSGVRLCNLQQSDSVWIGFNGKRKNRKKKRATVDTDSESTPYSGPMIRSQAKELNLTKLLN